MSNRTQWRVYFFSVNDVLYHLALYHPEVGYGDLCLLGARIFDREDPFFPRGEQSVFAVEVPDPEAMIAFMRKPNLLCSEIIDQERKRVGWHLLPEAPDFVLTLRSRRSEDPDNMNCVEWIVFALQQGGVKVPFNILTTSEFRKWLGTQKTASQ